jgi:hypothetical protein
MFAVHCLSLLILVVVDPSRGARRDRARGGPTLAVPDYQGHGGPVCVAEFGVRSEICLTSI